MSSLLESPQRERRRWHILLPCIFIAVALLAMAAIWAYRTFGIQPEQEERPQLLEQPSSSTHSTAPTPPEVLPVVKQSTATIGTTGDILLHDKVTKSGYDPETGTYNFDKIFDVFSAYVSKVDYAVANMEGTLRGTEDGYEYTGYPQFNAPDAIVDALKKAGFDMLLTANNHCFDTGERGFFRTQEVLKDREFDYIGTRYNDEDKNYIVKEINGIRIGMICYTYNTGLDADGNVLLYDTHLTAKASKLVNSFDYSNLGSFYKKLDGELNAMREDGAEAIMLYIHWGEEYKTKANSTQKEMAQALCDLGIDVIVGNHSHVAQPIELLSNTEDETKKTLCLYSTGNALSNIRKNSIWPAETEDGMLFSVTFAKYSDGTVILESANVLPTWVNRYTDGGKLHYKIMAMDGEDDTQWLPDMEWTDQLLTSCQRSYQRTMNIVGGGLDEANAFYKQKQIETEKRLNEK